MTPNSVKTSPNILLTDLTSVEGGDFKGSRHISINTAGRSHPVSETENAKDEMADKIVLINPCGKHLATIFTISSLF